MYCGYCEGICDFTVFKVIFGQLQVKSNLLFLSETLLYLQVSRNILETINFSRIIRECIRNRAVYL
jgi:hypothetical protein